jgi:hypothetical protein
MGKAMGSIASTVGKGGSVLGGIGEHVVDGAKKVGHGAKNLFGTGGMEVEGTGVNVDTLRQGGYSDAEINTFGAKKPSMAQRGTRAALMGIAGGMNQQQQPQQQQGQPVPIEVQPSVIDPALMQPVDYTMVNRDPFNMRRRYQNPMFGG